MADVDDVQGYQMKYDNQMTLLEDSNDLVEADRRALKRWIAHLRTNDSEVESLGTIVGHLNRMRLCAERSAMPLTEFESIDDVNTLELCLQDEHGLAASTIRGYKKGLRKFFQWSDDADFGDDVTIGAPIENKHDPEDEITTEELAAMLDATSEFDAAARDKAFIALLRDTGLRLGAVLSLRVGDVDLETRKATVQINTDGNVKDAEGRLPLTWSRGYLANWLDIHPRSDDPSVALIHKTRRFGPDDDGALRQQYAGRRITKIADAAGVDSDRIHAHLFRGTAISEWIRDGMTEQQIKHRAAWDEDSRMLSTYSMVSEEEMNDGIFDFYGIEGEGTDRSPDLEACTQCRTPLQGTERFCPSCAAPLDSTAVSVSDDVENGTFELAMNDSGDPNAAAFLTEFRERWQTDPEFRALLLGNGHDPSSDR